MPGSRTVSVVIPARDAAAAIGTVVAAVLEQRRPDSRVEALVVDDGSADGTAAAALRSGASVISCERRDGGGNPAAARNRGARAATGDPIVFLDADCVPAPDWLGHLLAAHDAGEVVVGGALDLPAGLTLTARCDYYCGWYHVHSRRAAGHVPNHPPGNLSVRREAFLATRGFTERMPLAYAHEELEWQAELARSGVRILFEPRSVVYHHNRPGLGNLLRRNYRWGYSSIESKARSGAARLPWLYRRPSVLMLLAVPFALVSAAYVVACWMRAGVFEPLVMLPVVLAARLAYGAGMVVGGVRWIRNRRGDPVPFRPRWE